MATKTWTNKQREAEKKRTIKAILGSAGIVSTIAKKLGVSWGTARTRIDTWDETKEAFQDEREMILDLSEKTIFKSIQEGDTTDAKWVLMRLGKDRRKRGTLQLQQNVS